MRLIPITGVLGLILTAVGIYRYGLVIQLLEDHPGFIGMTLFTGMLFVPATLAFRWRSAVEQRGGIGLLALAAALIFALLAVGTGGRMSLLGYAANAFILGLMEALLVPALQNWFSQGRNGGLAAGNAILWGLSCASLIASPILFALTRSIPPSLIGIGAIVPLAFLIRRLASGGLAPATPDAQSGQKPSSKLSALPVLFLIGTALGAVSNMIYPIALRLLELDGWRAGLYTCVPLLSAALGSWLLGTLGGNAARWFLGAFIIIPISFFGASREAVLPFLFCWGTCLGFIETAWLLKHDSFNEALSAKYIGLACGIILTGLVAEAGVNPVGAMAIAFYGTFLFGGTLWMAC